MLRRAHSGRQERVKVSSLRRICKFETGITWPEGICKRKGLYKCGARRRIEDDEILMHAPAAVQGLWWTWKHRDTLADLALARYSWLAKELRNSIRSIQQEISPFALILWQPPETSTNHCDRLWSNQDAYQTNYWCESRQSRSGQLFTIVLTRDCRCFEGAWSLTLVSLLVGISLLNSLPVKSGILHSKLSK